MKYEWVIIEIWLNIYSGNYTKSSKFLIILATQTYKASILFFLSASLVFKSKNRVRFLAAFNSTIRGVNFAATAFSRF